MTEPQFKALTPANLIGPAGPAALRQLPPPSYKCLSISVALQGLLLRDAAAVSRSVALRLAA